MGEVYTLRHVKRRIEHFKDIALGLFIPMYILIVWFAEVAPWIGLEQPSM